MEWKIPSDFEWKVNIYSMGSSWDGETAIPWGDRPQHKAEKAHHQLST